MVDDFHSRHLRLDTIGAMASLLCAVHCALMPLIVSFLPLIGLGFLSDSRIEWLLLLAALALGLKSLWPTYRYWHYKPQPLWLLACGAIVLFSTRLFLPHGSPREAPLTVIGALFLVSAHLYNRSLYRQCLDC